MLHSMQGGSEAREMPAGGPPKISRPAILDHPAGGHIGLMSLRPLYGLHSIRQRLARAALAGQLPASLLFHGPRGVGKQRLALWLGQLLLCERAAPEGLLDPCGECRHCRYAFRVRHPDLHWFFPRPRLKDTDADTAEVRADLADATAERMQQDGLWAAPSGTEGLHVATVRALVQVACMRPAMARRSVFVVGDADRMVSQTGSDQAANAFLKLLEEPPPDCTIILTSSEPGALIPTIRSRVVSVRVPALAAGDVAAFLDDEAVARRLKGVPRADAVATAGGAPGGLFGAESSATAFQAARRLMEAALQQAGPHGAGDRLKAAAKQGSAGARGAFSATLDALTVLLHDRARSLAAAGQVRPARRAAQAVVSVQLAKDKAQGNVSPQLLTASLLVTLQKLLSS